MNIERQNPVSREWNTLIILDACRYDLFKQANVIEGNLFKYDSQSVNTQGWYRNNFQDIDCSNFELISQQPQPWTDDAGSFNFKKKVALWNKDYWLNMDRVFKDISVSDDLRTIIHLVPPHLPYLSPKGKRFMKEELDSYSGSPEAFRKIEEYGFNNGWDIVRKIYANEIRWITSKIERSFLEPDVITADHGEEIGDYDRYGHNKNRDVVRIVPWLEVK